MSVEVIAIGGYEEVGKSISTKPLEKVSSKSVRPSEFLIRNFKNYRFLKARISKKLAMEAKT